MGRKRGVSELLKNHPHHQAVDGVKGGVRKERKHGRPGLAPYFFMA